VYQSERAIQKLPSRLEGGVSERTMSYKPGKLVERMAKKTKRGLQIPKTQGGGSYSKSADPDSAEKNHTGKKRGDE